ncbi:MAG: UDP-N-acetylmuramoylalanine--D-glutamate ligase [Candidatus Paceibacteria bacterium]|jgi:UDP-N-acetylmuramoylalanine--D-glutamate ligase
MEIKDQKIAIIGFGVSGQGAGDYLIKKGAEVHYFDERDESKIDEVTLSIFKDKGFKFFLADNYSDHDDLEGYDILLVSPSVSETHPKVLSAKDKNIPVHLDVTMFLELWNKKGPVVGVTGSNGKSTVASLLHEVLQSCGRRSHLGGNIGTSPLTWIDKTKEGDVIIIELSSYQLKFFNDSHYADIAVITNISNNHLDKHNNSFSEYAETKLKIASQSNTELIIDLDNEGIQKYIVPNLKGFDVFPVSLKTEYKEASDDGVYTNAKGDIVVNDKVVFGANTERIIMGEHNFYNIAYVLAVLHKLEVECDATKAISSFEGLRHRIQKVTEIEGVTYVNDSKSTSPDATLKALETLTTGKKNIVLISGGNNKGATYEILETIFRENIKVVIFTAGPAKEQLIKILDEGVIVETADSMKDAVEIAKDRSTAGDIVLLSPAAASNMEMFKNFEERGDMFVTEVSKYENSN